jgi:SAM-dependent methyltransferase
MSSAALWHEVECGGYTVDLEVWARLAESVDGPLLELGCGSGRVALELARRGGEVWALDADPVLLEALAARSAAQGLRVQTSCADVRAFGLARSFELILAPMQLFQVLGGAPGRRAALARAAAHLRPRGRLAAAIVEPRAASGDGPPRPCRTFARKTAGSTRASRWPRSPGAEAWRSGAFDSRFLPTAR